MTTPQFLAEHDDLFAKWGRMVGQYGIPLTGMVATKPSEPPKLWRELTGRNTAAFVEAFKEFYRRWRLARLAAPNLPEPVGPALAPLTVPELIRRTETGGLTYHLPDIFPVPSRDELRGALENARSQAEPDHLREWFELIRGDNVGKSEIYPLGRRFELQHFWRALHERHPNALHGEAYSLRHAFALFLHVSPETVRKDLSKIADRLGPNWHLRH